ncbi:hypothetical protein [Nocardia sp. NPDC051832]|uniref:hypothetical protein n=1 Tax=Nocardia sp. NPDC051832 TaxID=3155673 RepID=UPI00341D283D
MRKTPQEKKRLSYAKDCRNEYGENDKASRKNIPRARARAHRANRHFDAQSLARAAGPVDVAWADHAEQEVRAHRRKVFRKRRDIPLGEHVVWKLGRRNVPKPPRHAADSPSRSEAAGAPDMSGMSVAHGKQIVRRHDPRGAAQEVW